MKRCWNSSVDSPAASDEECQAKRLCTPNRFGSLRQGIVTKHDDAFSDKIVKNVDNNVNTRSCQSWGSKPSANLFLVKPVGKRSRVEVDGDDDDRRYEKQGIKPHVSNDVNCTTLNVGHTATADSGGHDRDSVVPNAFTSFSYWRVKPDFELAATPDPNSTPQAQLDGVAEETMDST